MSRKGGGVFVLVRDIFQSMEPEERQVDFEMTWVQIIVAGPRNLYVGALYLPPDSDDPGYLARLDTCLPIQDT